MTSWFDFDLIWFFIWESKNRTGNDELVFGPGMVKDNKDINKTNIHRLIHERTNAMDALIDWNLYQHWFLSIWSIHFSCGWLMIPLSGVSSRASPRRWIQIIQSRWRHYLEFWNFMKNIYRTEQWETTKTKKKWFSERTEATIGSVFRTQFDCRILLPSLIVFSCSFFFRLEHSCQFQ